MLVTEKSDNFPIFYIKGGSEKYEILAKRIRRIYSLESRNLLYEALFILE